MGRGRSELNHHGWKLTRMRSWTIASLQSPVMTSIALTFRVYDEVVSKSRSSFTRIVPVEVRWPVRWTKREVPSAFTAGGRLRPGSVTRQRSHQNREREMSPWWIAALDGRATSIARRMTRLQLDQLICIQRSGFSKAAMSTAGSGAMGGGPEQA